MRYLDVVTVNIDKELIMGLEKMNCRIDVAMEVLDIDDRSFNWTSSAISDTVDPLRVK